VTVVDDIKKRVDRRLAELEPMMAEYQELLAVKQGLDTQSRGSAASAPRARRPQRTAGRRGSKAPGRSKPGRAEQAIALISASPGITVKEIAQEMKINDNYLYRLLPRMEREGKLKRQAKGWAVK
jgi:hypothetical protein